jgi:soluble lytic murein transglycosylase-like protein
VTRSELEAIARAAAREFRIPPRGYLAQIRAESAWDPLAVSSAGAMGLAQITPAAMSDTGILGDPFDPRINLRVGAAYMVWVRNWLRGQDLPHTWPYVLGGYNAGIGRVRAAVRARGELWLDAMPAETRSYVSRLAPEFSETPAPNTTALVALALVAAAALWSTST